jgi:DNA-binding NarL/FixJ family response regulator
MIEVVLADDHPPLRAGIRQTLDREQDIRVVGEAGSGPELFTVLAQRSAPTVLLLDIRMPDFDIIEALPRLKLRYPGMRILIVTAHDDRTYISQLLDIGVDGYLIKDEGMGAYVRAVRDVADGRTYFSQRVIGAAVEALEDQASPSPKELQVLALVAQDATSAEIAERLYISPRTVDTHVRRACQKLGVKSRAAAVARAIELGLITTSGMGSGGPRG